MAKSKVGPNPGPVPLHKGLAAGESLTSAESCATGHTPTKTPSKNTK